MMKTNIKRIYDKAEKKDGMRVLVDRLWPRGVKKSDANIDLWAREVAPSNELRAWFHKDKDERFRDFSKKYKQELIASKEITALKKSLRGQQVVTLVTGVNDVEHSHIPTLRTYFK